MLSWIPLIGPIIQGLVSIYTSFTDKQVAFRTAEVDEAKVSAQIIQTNSANIGLRIMVDMICLPVAVWVMLISWDTIVAQTSWKVYMWHVASFDKTSIPYLPYAVLTFLLGNIGINMWNRK